MEPGTRLGAYEVLAAIGRGTSGAVVRARAPDGRVVAVKVLERASEAALGRFERERRVLSEIGEAEGFVQLLDVGTSPHGPYIVMTCVEGGTLAARIAAGPLDGEAVRLLGLALARALAAAHARGIVHRDMKPSNVLLRADGRPLIADLGLAKHFERSAPGAAASRDLTQTGSIHGSMGYMAPEQLGDSKSVGPPADVFALGTILYECLMGSLPFTAPSLVGLLVKIEGGQREPIRSRRPDVDRRLARTIERCLAATPAERFEDGAALARELEQAKPPARARALAGALLAVAVVAGAAAAFVKARPAPQPGTASPPRPPGPSPPAPPPPPPRPPAGTSNADALALARSALARSKQDPEAAIDQASRAVALDQGCALARVARAQARLDLEYRLAGGRAPAMKARAAEAAAIRADIEAALGLDARCAAAYSIRASLAALEGDRSAAHEDSQRAIELDPRDGRAHLLSATWFLHKDPARALTHIDATIAAGYEPGRAWSLRAMLHSQKNRDDLALQDLDHAVEGDPLDASVIATRAELHLRRADYEAALRDAERAIALDPVNAIGWHVRGAARGERGEPKLALEDLGRALELAPSAAPTYCVRGVIHLKLGDTAKAIADFGQAIALRKDFALAYDLRAAVLESVGDARGAIEDSRACIKLSPSSPLAGRCRDRLARLEKK